MFGLDFGEIILVIVVAFVIYGPEQLPQMIRKGFKLINTVKDYAFQARNKMHQLSRDLEREVDPEQWSGSESSSAATESEDLCTEGYEAQSAGITTTDSDGWEDEYPDADNDGKFEVDDYQYADSDRLREDGWEDDQSPEQSPNINS